MRRDKEDQQWQQVKEITYKRDNGEDRFIKSLTALQASYFFKHNKTSLINTLDPAHILAVGRYEHIMYEPNNIVWINRVAHERLDSHKNPLTGKLETPENIKKWWKLIMGKEQFIYMSTHYEDFQKLFNN